MTKKIENTVILFPGEKFKEILIPHGPLRNRYAISNFGRFVSFTYKIEQGRIIKGGSVDGYRGFPYKVKIDGKQVHKTLFLYKQVAEKFLTKTSEDQIYVIHLDYNRANDHVKNLKYVNYEERMDHYRKSPHVIQAKLNLIEHNRNSDSYKLTKSRVILLKKKLADPNRKTRIKILAKQFGISEMQLYRIKRGENWGHVKI